MAVAGVAALGALWLATGSAEAYPPGTKLNVASGAVTSPVPGQFLVPLVITNAPPNCQLAITVKDSLITTVTSGPAGGPGQGVTVPTSITLSPSKDGTSSIRVQSQCKPRESATTKVRLARARVEAEDGGKCRVKKDCEVRAVNFPPNVLVTFTAMPGSGGPSLVKTKKTNKEGHAEVEFSFPTEGSSTVVGASGGLSHSTYITVSKKK